MRNLVSRIAVVCAVALATNSAAAREPQPRLNYEFALTWPWSHSLDSDINNLNRMRGHVRWLFRNYKSNPQVRSDYFAVSHEIDDINARYKQSKVDRRQLRRDVDRAHSELHRTDLELRAKQSYFSPWR
jgi:hypothetical protein